MRSRPCNKYVSYGGNLTLFFIFSRLDGTQMHSDPICAVGSGTCPGSRAPSSVNVCLQQCHFSQFSALDCREFANALARLTRHTRRSAWPFVFISDPTRLHTRTPETRMRSYARAKKYQVSPDTSIAQSSQSSPLLDIDEYWVSTISPSVEDGHEYEMDCELWKCGLRFSIRVDCL